MNSHVTVEIFGESGNFAIVRLPDRKSPGVVFQLDSLERIFADLQAASRMIHGGSPAEAASEIDAICSELQEISAHVKRVFRQD